MSAKKTEVREMASVVHKTPKKRIISVDIEGKTNGNHSLINQISFVDGMGKAVLDEKYENGILTKKQKDAIQRCLNFASILVGFNLNADLKILGDNGFYLNQNIVCIDCALTFQASEIKAERKEWGKWQNGHKKRLKEVCQYFGIEAEHFHTSIVDATCSMKLFWKLIAKTEKMVVLKTTKAERRLVSSPEEAVKTKGAVINMVNNEKTEPTQLKIGDLVSVPESKAKNHYEGIVEFGGVTFVIHLNTREYDLLRRIRVVNPEYTLNCFYETILRPKQIKFLIDKWAKEQGNLMEPVLDVEEETD